MSTIQPNVTETAQRVYPIRAAVTFLGIGVLGALVPLVPHVGLYAMVFGMLALWLLPIWRDRARGDLDYFEPIHCLGLLFLISYGLGAIWTVQDPGEVAYDRYVVGYIPLSLFYVLIGYALMLAAYYLPWQSRRTATGRAEYPKGGAFLVLPAVAGFVGFLAQVMWYRAAKLGLSLAGLISSLGQLAPLFVFAWAMAWLLYFGGRATPTVKLLLFGFMVPAAGIVVVNSLNNKSLVLSLAIVPLMALWYGKRKIPWTPLIALGLIVVFVVFPFNNTFRKLDERIPVADRLWMTTQIIDDWSYDEYLRRSVGTFKLRMALINSVAVVIRDVPRWVPFADGRTIFMPTMVFLIPRVLWPDKPTMTFGREFGETFRVVHILDEETNMAVTVPGELYWNFSWPGILLGMALWGVCLRLYYRRYGESRDLDPIKRAIHLVLLIQFLHFESGIAGPTVILLRTLLIMEGYRLLGRRLGLVEVTDDPSPALQRS